MRSWTVIVRTADAYWQTVGIWVAVVASEARADRFVVDDVANGVGTAGTRVPADGINAGPLDWTVAVGLALDSRDGRDDLAGAAAAADVAARTDADHRPHGQAGQHLARRRLVARTDDGARVLAAVVEAGQLARAVAVFSALGLFFGLAGDVGVTHVVGRTSAHGQVVSDVALAAVGALVVPDARVDALRVDTGVLGWTVAVTVAADNAAADLRVAVVARATATLGRVVGDVALGVSATCVREQARVDAVVVDASLVGGAFGVATTFETVAGNFGVTLVSGLAGADRAMVLHVADCVGAAAARLAALTVDAGFVVRTVVVLRAHAFVC